MYIYVYIYVYVYIYYIYVYIVIYIYYPLYIGDDHLHEQGIPTSQYFWEDPLSRRS